jgi:hypothetical protein
MRGRWSGLAVLAMAIWGMIGCRSEESSLRPPPNPEVFTLPPTDDPRFSEPVAYPKGSLNQDLLKRDKDREDSTPGGMPKGMSRFSGGGGGGG